MPLVDDLAAMTQSMESSVEHVISYEDAYTLLLRSYLEIKQLNHRIALLEAKARQNDNRTKT